MCTLRNFSTTNILTNFIRLPSYKQERTSSSKTTLKKPMCFATTLSNKYYQSLIHSIELMKHPRNSKKHSLISVKFKKPKFQFHSLIKTINMCTLRNFSTTNILTNFIRLPSYKQERTSSSKTTLKKTNVFCNYIEQQVLPVSNPLHSQCLDKAQIIELLNYTKYISIEVCHLVVHLQILSRTT
jgi:hypothetical protein